MTYKGETEFGSWAARFTEFYPDARLEKEFLFTRKLVLTARRWTTYIDEVVKQKTGHPRTHWQTLSALSFSDEPVATLELSRRMAIQWPTLIRTLNALEAGSLIRREVDPQDRRSRLLSITPAGRELMVEVRAILDPARSRVLAGFKDEELEIGEQILDRLFQAVTDDTKERD